MADCSGIYHCKVPDTILDIGWIQFLGQLVSYLLEPVLVYQPCVSIEDLKKGCQISCRDPTYKIVYAHKVLKIIPHIPDNYNFTYLQLIIQRAQAVTSKVIWTQLGESTETLADIFSTTKTEQKKLFFCFVLFAVVYQLKVIPKIKCKYAFILCCNAAALYRCINYLSTATQRNALKLMFTCSTAMQQSAQRQKCDHCNFLQCSCRAAVDYERNLRILHFIGNYDNNKSR